MTAYCGLLQEVQPVFALEDTVLDSVVILNKDVYDLEKEALPFMPYGLINKLHIVTRAGIIRRELLFKPGERVDEDLIAETERRLRSFPFIRVAEITVDKDESGISKASVYTQDSWTTKPQVSIGGGGGEVKTAAGIEEMNFLGLGKDIAFFYENNEEGKISRQMFYNDPHFLPGYWELMSFFSRSSDGSADVISLKRPYYKLDTPWSVQLDLDRENLEKSVYEYNELLATLHRKRFLTEAFVSVKVSSDDRSASRAGPGFIYEENTFYDLQSSAVLDLPGKYTLKAPGLFFQRINYDYVKVKNVNSFERIEDYNLGCEIKLKCGYSPKEFGTEADASVLKLQGSRGFSFGRDNFLLAKLDAKGIYTDNKPRNLVAESGLNYYNRIFNNQTFALNLMGVYGKNLDIDKRLVLGGLNGLRGYPAREFNGTKLLLVNVEDRLFWIEEFLSLAGIGGVLFFDSGYVWDEGETVRLSDMKSDIGAGFRIAFTRSSEGIVLRLDFAYALDEIRDEGRYVVSFGSSQSF